ncbi:MAG: hypothetical protein Kow0077_28660 [Anaerolineae bacterium]
MELMLRAPNLDDDVSAAVAVIHAAVTAMPGTRDWTETDLRAEWAMPGFALADDARLASLPDGTLAGVAWVRHGEPLGRAQVLGFVHPAFWGQGIGGRLLTWAQTRAEALRPDTPEGAPLKLVTGCVAEHDRARRLFERNGYRPVRRYLRMVRELDPYTLPDLPDWPEGFTLRPYFRKIDDRFIYQLLEEAFRTHWGYEPRSFDQWRARMMRPGAFDPDLWFMAVTLESGGDDIVGVALCRDGLPEDPEIGWVRALAVLPAFQGRGVGRALLQYAIGEFHRRGKARVGLTVDAENATGAVRLYEKLGFQPVVQWIEYEKALA